MRPSPPINDRSNHRHSGWLSADSAHARISVRGFTTNRATNLVAQRADRSFTPTHAPMLGGKPFAATAPLHLIEPEPAAKSP